MSLDSTSLTAITRSVARPNYRVKLNSLCLQSHQKTLQNVLDAVKSSGIRCALMLDTKVSVTSTA